MGGSVLCLSQGRCPAAVCASSRLSDWPLKVTELHGASVSPAPPWPFPPLASGCLATPTPGDRGAVLESGVREWMEEVPVRREQSALHTGLGGPRDGPHSCAEGGLRCHRAGGRGRGRRGAGRRAWRRAASHCPLPSDGGDRGGRSGWKADPGLVEGRTEEACPGDPVQVTQARWPSWRPPAVVKLPPPGALDPTPRLATCSRTGSERSWGSPFPCNKRGG